MESYKFDGSDKMDKQNFDFSNDKNELKKFCEDNLSYIIDDNMKISIINKTINKNYREIILGFDIIIQKEILDNDRLTIKYFLWDNIKLDVSQFLEFFEHKFSNKFSIKSVSISKKYLDSDNKWTAKIVDLTNIENESIEIEKYDNLKIEIIYNETFKKV
jgi:hypothetical protein